MPQEYRRIRNGDRIGIGEREWEVVSGYGHSPEHSVLYCVKDKLLIFGDMVLPRISTNVSVFAIEPEGNPLALYLESLGRYETIPADTLALPSHGKPFRGGRRASGNCGITIARGSRKCAKRARRKRAAQRISCRSCSSASSISIR